MPYLGMYQNKFYSSLAKIQVLFGNLISSMVSNFGGIPPYGMPRCCSIINVRQDYPIIIILASGSMYPRTFHVPTIRCNYASHSKGKPAPSHEI